MKKFREYPVMIRLTIILFFAVLAVYSLIMAKHILAPVALAVLLSYLLFPVVAFLEYTVRFPRALAVLFTVLLFMAVSGGLVSIMVKQLNNLANDETVQKYSGENIAALQEFIAEKTGISLEMQESWLKNKRKTFLEFKGESKKLFMQFAFLLEALLFIPVFTFFMLFFRDRAEIFIHKLAKRSHADLAERLIKQISKVTIKYVTGVTIVVLILAVLHATALSIIGVKYAFILGIITACFSFIPYFGTVVSGLVPLTFVLVAQDNPYIALAVALYYMSISLIDHNILTPAIVGGKVHLNPFITILSILIGASIWGISGMIIVVPFVAVIKIICDNVESLKPFGYILGVEKGGLSISRITNYFLKRKNK